MATPKATRIGIWVIATVMMIGTLGSFAVMILANDNAKIDREAQNKAYAQVKKQQDEQARAGVALSEKYYGQFTTYQAEVTAFDAAQVGKDVKIRDIKVGEGADIASNTKYQAYYIGWNPKGKVFDSSIEGTKLKAPLDTSAIEGGLIPGWQSGVVGMKVGGVRELTIPSEFAYGEQARGDTIPPNTPLKFIIMMIATK